MSDEPEEKYVRRRRASKIVDGENGIEEILKTQDEVRFQTKTVYSQSFFYSKDSLFFSVIET